LRIELLSTQKRVLQETGKIYLSKQKAL
jgi:hypothetical protein